MHSLSAVYYHIVFSTKGRRALIHPGWQADLHAYISGIVRNKGCLPIAIGGMPDHIHLLIRAKTTTVVSDLVREIKKSSSRYIKEENSSEYLFQWQEGFSVFSVSSSVVPAVCRYIENQQKHLLHTTWEEEFRFFEQELTTSR